MVNSIKVGECVRIVTPTEYKKRSRWGGYAWLGEDLMEVGTVKKVTKIFNEYTVFLENRLVYDIDWIELVHKYTDISDKLFTM